MNCETAGIPGPGGMVEDHGLFGAINAAPEPATIGLTLAGLALMWGARKRFGRQ